MASEKSLILRNAAARARLGAAVAAIRSQGVDIPELATTHRDPQVAKSQELEYFADTMEVIAAALVAPNENSDAADVSDAPPKTVRAKLKTTKSKK